MIVMLIGVLSIAAQTTVVDTFENTIQRQPNDSMRLLKTIQIAKYFENIDSAIAWKYYRIAKQLAEKENTDIAKIEILELEGVLYTKNNPAKAYTLYTEAIDQCKKFRSDTAIKKYEASLMNNLGVISYLNGDYEGAVQAFIESVKIYERYDITNGNLIPTLANISTTYGELNYPSKAKEYSVAAVKYAEKYGNAKLKATSYINLGNNLLELNKLDSGIAAIRHALDLTMITTNQYDLYLCYTNIGIYFDKSNNGDSSLYYFKKALPLAKTINSPFDISACMNRIITIELANKNYTESKKLLDSAKIINKTFGFKNNEKDWYQLMAEFYRRTNNMEAAITSLKKYDELKDSLLNESRLKRIDFLEERYQSEKKQNAIGELQKEQKIQELNLKQKSTLNYILIGALITVLLIGFLLYKNYRQKQILQQKKISELEKDKQLMAVDAMLKGQEEERSRLAKDLHDGLGGMLSGIKYSLNNMKDNLIVTPDNMAVFERSLDMIDASIKELRRVAHNMMPEMLIKFGLDEALKEYGNSVTATGRLTVKYQSFGMKERIDSSVEIITYRIVQELLNNVLKHAVATEVLVQLIKEENRLNILVEDNGKGFEASTLENSKGAGWTNIRSRVDYLKGRLDINSEINKGTSISIEFNLQ
jgi:signal transduction histidine kinase